MDIVRTKATAQGLAAGCQGAERILIVGPLGQGVGLVADAVTSAATRAGLPAGSREFMRPALDRRACAAVVRFDRAAGSATAPADVLLAFGAAAVAEARPFLAKGGCGLALVDACPSARGILPAPRCERFFDARIRWWSEPASSETPLAKVWTMLGWLSGRVSLPSAVWRDVLSESVPRRVIAAARAAFERGRFVDCRAYRSGRTGLE